jgi:hypothetical protein
MVLSMGRPAHPLANSKGAGMRIFILIIAAGLSSCSFFGDEDETRTLPHISSFELVSINELNRTVELPGSYNVRGYVISVNSCPEGALCIIPDGVMLYAFDDLSPDDEEIREDGIYLATADPLQFIVGNRYEISVTVDHERVPSASWPAAKIVGYDPAFR